MVKAAALLAALPLLAVGCAQDPGSTPTTEPGDGEDSSATTPASQEEPPPVPEDAVLPAGDGNAECADGTALAYIGTIAGGNAALGMNILHGARLAVKEHNEANPGCQVTLKEFDSQGTPDTAPGVVTQAINDDSILGIVGLPFSGESNAVGDAFNDAGLVTITPAATNPALSENGWRTFFRGLGNDSVQGPAAARFIEDTLGAESVCVVHDDSEYGLGLGEIVAEELGDKLVCQEEIKTNQREFSAVIGSLASNEPDAIFFSGYYNEAAPFTQQLRDQGVEADLVAPDGVRDMEYVNNAGGAAEGVYLTCPCLPSAGFTEFTEAYEAEAGQEPSTYSPEGYDVTTILLQGIDQGIDNRADLLEFVRGYEGQGLTKMFQWDDSGELSETPVWAYQVVDGEIVQYADITS